MASSSEQGGGRRFTGFLAGYVAAGGNPDHAEAAFARWYAGLMASRREAAAYRSAGHG